MYYNFIYQLHINKAEKKRIHGENSYIMEKRNNLLLQI